MRSEPARQSSTRQLVSSSQLSEATLRLSARLLYFCSRFCSWKSESTHQTRSSAQDSALESLSQPTKLVLLLKILLLKVWVNLPNSFFFSRFCSWKSESTYQTRSSSQDSALESLSQPTKQGASFQSLIISMGPDDHTEWFYHLYLNFEIDNSCL
jgi:hypothetical protein